MIDQTPSWNERIAGGVLERGLVDTADPSQRSGAAVVIDLEYADNRDCATHPVRELVEAFLGAYNTGESNLSDRFFALSFEWYNDAPGRSDPGGLRGTLEAYFAARHAQRDQLAFLKMTYFAYEFRDGTGGFGVDVNRTDDKTAQPNC